MSIRAALVCSLLLAACTADEVTPTSDRDELELTAIDDSTITGSFVHDGSVVAFTTTSIGDRATLAIELDGVRLDVELDLAAQRFVDDGHGGILYSTDVDTLRALRDALLDHPELNGTLHGMLLARHTDWLAQAPAGSPFTRRETDGRALQQARERDPRVSGADADGCGGDGATCLWGTDGWDWAVFDPGNDGACQWRWFQYGESQANCSGRCGAGCNHWFDDDYTWDCFDHDRCVDSYGGSVMSDNPNCGDEFWDAADDYALTYFSWC